MAILRNIIEIDEGLCNGCGQCILACAEKALELIDGKARVVSDNLCDGLGACIGECPTGALKITIKEVDEFDEKAVAKHLKTTSSSPLRSCSDQYFQAAGSIAIKALTHWPIKLRLLPISASFLDNADLLIAADCTAFSSSKFHENYLKEKVLLTACSKFEDTGYILEKLTTIFKTHPIYSVTVVSMEVPCCKGLFRLVQQALFAAKISLMPTHVILSIQGQPLQKI